MAVGVLNLNNMRDHEGDKVSGKNTLVVKMGFDKAKQYHALLLLTAWACMLVYLQDWRGLLWYVLIALVCAKHVKFVWDTKDPKILDPELKKVALMACVTGMFMLMTVTL